MPMEKLHKLGKGSFGTVYLAVDCRCPLPDTVLAVKTAPLESSSTLIKEAQFLKQLKGNPYIVECYGEDISWEEKNGGYVFNLLMEYADGGSLADLINSYERMSESHVACYTYMILRGLSYLHRRGVVHCDIKPKNILVFGNQQRLKDLKLADFGLSKTVWENVSNFRGTPDYAPPESLQGEQGTAADIWSLGCTVVEMMNGGKDIWKLPEYVSKSGKDFLMRCFQSNVESRWTADMLLRHPFIQEHVGGGPIPPIEWEEYGNIQKNYEPWSVTVERFSSSSPTVFITEVMTTLKTLIL